MSFIPFQVSESGEFSASLSGVGEKLIAFSTSDAANDRAGVKLVGNVASTSTLETLALSTDSRIERETTNSFETLSSLSIVTTPLTGSIYLYNQGVAAEGDLRIDSVPADGATLIIGLAGYTQTYTFVCPAAFTLSTGTAASVTTIADSDYFDIAIAGTTYRFWFEVDGAGGVAPADPGVLTKVSILSTDTNADVATTLEASMETAITGWTCSVSSSTITAVKNVLGTATLTFTDGAAAAATGITYSEAGELGEGTADAADQIRTGYSASTGAAATTTEIALYIQYAMNASGGTAGTQYGTGTAAHAYLSALASSSVTAVTDRLACRRQLGWSSTPPTGITIRDPIGGEYGTLIGIVSGSSGIASGMVFDTPDVSDATLNALFASTTDWIQAQGRQASLRLYLASASTPITIKLQGSEDGLTAYDLSGETANLTGTVSGTAAAYVLTGVSTVFTSEVRVGETIIIAGYAYTVASIASDTSLTTVQPLATSPAGANYKKQLNMQIAKLLNNSQLIPIPQCEYCRLSFVTNANTAQVNLHAGLIL